MQYTPKKESEITGNRNLLDPGQYPFVVLESSEKQSKSQKNFGKLMVSLKLGVFTGDGDRQQWVFDNFADWFSEWKLRHFPYATGHGAAYESGAFDATNNACQGWAGVVEIGIEKNKETGEQRNVVKDYVVPEEKTAAPAAKAAEAAKESDDVPF